MSLQQRFKQFVQEENLFQPQHRLLIAVSGGMDSVALAHLCHKAGYSFAIAHCNYGLRGEESNRDEDFVRKLAAQLGVEIFVKHFDTMQYVEDNKLSVQEAARILRYEWFVELLNQQQPKLNRILTAHHADDNVETILMHLFKGTGLKGLTGIHLRFEQLVRPLLFARRSEIEAYAAEQQLSFVTDSSNALDKYDRNFLRNKVLPLVREHYPQVDENIIASISRFKKAGLIYREAIEQKKKTLLEQRDGEWHIPVRKLAKQYPLSTIVYEVIQPFGFSAAQTVEVMKLLDAATGKEVASHTHRIIRNRDWLIISPVKNMAASVHVIDNENEVTETVAGTLSVKIVKTEPNISFSNDPFLAMIDAGKISFPLILRKWKTGDYFYPLGMNKKKKLSRFFIDLKLSKTEKEKTWVLESGKKIIWVIGHRINERVKITPSTFSHYQFLFRPATT